MEQHLSQYRIFYEVARCGNISRAAKELYISQPAISKAISKLEENLSTRLFLRNSRGVQLTREGLVLYQHVSAAFESLDRGEKELKRIHDFHIGHLCIGVSSTLCKYVLLPYLKGFIEKYPHVNISIETQSTVHTLDMIEDRRIDVGLVAEPRNRKNIYFSPVMEIHDGFVCTRSYLDNLLLREGKDTDIFQTGNIMLLDRNNMTRNHIDRYFADQHLETNHLLEVTSMDLLIEFSRIGLGIGCVIKEFVRDDLDAGSLIEVPLSAPVPERVIGFACTTQDTSDTLREFLNFCRSMGRQVS